MGDDTVLPLVEGGDGTDNCTGAGAGAGGSGNPNGSGNGNGNGTDKDLLAEQPQEDDRKSKKKTRLQWDEENLTLNALEMERTPKMKIDEPKTPYANGPASETGSSTSGSAPGSPAPYFMPKERLRGFQALEEAAAAASGSGSSGVAAAASTPDGTVLRITRGVQIVDDPAGIGGGDGPSEEFEAKRRKHYAGEAAQARAPRAVQIVDAREETADGTAPVENAEFSARRQQHYANEARLMRAEWSGERERMELQPEAPMNEANGHGEDDDDEDSDDNLGVREQGLPNGASSSVSASGNGNVAANGTY